MNCRLAALAVAVVALGLAWDRIDGTPPWTRIAFSVIPFGYLALWLATTVPTRWGQRNDLSYGTYIYGFVLQQSLAVAGAYRLGWQIFLVLSLVCTLPLLAASWFLVERRALRLKDWTPRRVGFLWDRRLGRVR